jgi:uncharacterized repeat protein (TIGR01451 family)
VEKVIYRFKLILIILFSLIFVLQITAQEPLPTPKLNVTFNNSDVTTLSQPIDLGTRLTIDLSINAVFQVSNSGDAPLTVAGVQVDQGFSAEYDIGLLEGGDTTDLVLSCVQTEVGQYITTIVVESEELAPVSFQVSCTVQAPPQLTVMLEGADVSVLPQPIDLGTRSTTGTPLTRVFHLANTGDAPLNIVGVSVDSDFTVDNPTVALNGGEGHDLPVACAQVASGSYVGTITITSSELAEFRFQVACQVQTPPLMVVSLEGAEVTSLQQPIDLGVRTTADAAAARDFSILNIGQMPLTITSVTADGGFAVETVSIVLGNGQSTGFNVQCVQSSEGPYTGSVMVTTGEVGNFNFSVSCLVNNPPADVNSEPDPVSTTDVVIVPTSEPSVEPTAEVIVLPQPTAESTYITDPSPLPIDETDTDGDGIRDAVDACPTVGASVYGLLPDGCPKIASSNLQQQGEIAVLVDPYTPIEGAPVTLKLVTTGQTIISWTVDGVDVLNDDNTLKTNSVITVPAPRVGLIPVVLLVEKGGVQTPVELEFDVQPKPAVPDITFTADVQAGTIPLTVNYTLNVQGVDDPVCVFNSGSTLVTALCEGTVTHQYSIANTYEATFYVVVGDHSYDAAPLLIAAYEQPVVPQPSFKFDKLVSPTQVKFINTSTGNYTAVAWRVVNAGVEERTSTQLNPVFTLTPNTFYDIYLQVCSVDDTNSCAETVQRYFMPSVQSLKAGFIVNNSQCSTTSCVPSTTCQAPCAVTVTSTASGEVDRLDYDWGTGEFKFDAGRTATYQYPNVGKYVVRQIATDVYGRLDIFEAIVNVVPPQVSASCQMTRHAPTGLEGATRGALVGETISFKFVLHNATLADVTGIDWDLGNGVHSDQPEVSTQYAAAAEYKPQVTITVDGMLPKTVSCGTLKITTNDVPFIWLEVSPQVIYVGEQVKLTLRSIGMIDLGASQIDYQDGPIVFYSNPNAIYHTYTTIGQYTITWTTLNSQGDPISATIRVTVRPRVTAVITPIDLPPNATLVNPTLIECQGICALAFDSSASEGVSSRVWSRVGGTTETQESYGVVFKPSFRSFGEYTITLINREANGQPPRTATATFLVNVVTPQTITIAPTASVYVGLTPFSPILTANTTPFTDNVLWTSGTDLITAPRLASWQPTYTEPGIYRVTAQAVSTAQNPTGSLKLFVYSNQTPFVQTYYTLDNLKVCFYVTATGTSLYWILPDGTILGQGPQLCDIDLSLVEGVNVTLVGSSNGSDITEIGFVTVTSPDPSETPDPSKTPSGAPLIKVLTPGATATPDVTATPLSTSTPETAVGGNGGDSTNPSSDIGHDIGQLLPQRQAAIIYGEVHQELTHQFVSGETIYDVAENECGSTADWHGVAYHAFSPYLNLNTFDARPVLLNPDLATTISVSYNDEDGLLELGQTVRVTLTLRNVSSGSWQKVKLSDVLPPYFHYENRSVTVQVAGGDERRASTAGIKLDEVTNTLTIDIDEALALSQIINKNVQLVVTYQMSAPTPFERLDGTTIHFSCPTPAQTEHVNEIFASPVAGLNADQVCHTAQAFVKYLEIRTNDERETLAVTYETTDVIEGFINAIIGEAIAQGKLSAEKRAEYVALLTKINDELNKQEELNKSLNQLGYVQETMTRLLLTNPDNVGYKTALADAQAQIVLITDALKASQETLDKLLNEDLLAKVQEIAKLTNEQFDTFDNLAYQLTLYAGSGGRFRVSNEGSDLDFYSGDGASRFKRTNEGGDLTAQFQALLEAALAWQDAVCEKGNVLDESTSLNVLNWDVTPYEDKCAGYVTEVLLGDPNYTPERNAEDELFYRSDVCDNPPPGVTPSLSCLPPVEAAYMYIYDPQFADRRYTVSDAVTELGSDLTQSGIRVGDVVVMDRGVNGASSQWGHVCVVRNVFENSVVCVGTSDEDGELQVMRFSRGSLQDYIYISMQTMADFTFPDENKDTVPDTPGLTVEFTNTSTENAGTQIVKETWNFGDGTPVTNRAITPVDLPAEGEAPSPFAPMLHTFTNGGTFTVTMRVERENGIINTVSHIVKVSAFCETPGLDIPYSECVALESFAAATHWDVSPSNAGPGKWFTSPQMCSATGLACTPAVDASGKFHITGIQLPDVGLDGTLTKDISALPALSMFDVSGNPLTGELFPEYQAWTQMQHFDVSDTKLGGYLFFEYATWKNIEYFDISSAYFFDDLPPQFGTSWLKATYIDVSSNVFSNLVPASWMSFVTPGKTLILDNNLLEGFDHNIAGLTPNPKLKPLYDSQPTWEAKQTIQPTNVVVKATAPTELQVTFTPHEDTLPGEIQVTCDTSNLGTNGSHFNSGNAGLLALFDSVSGGGGRFRVSNEGDLFTLLPNEKGTRVTQTVAADATSVVFKNLTPDTVYYCAARRYMPASGDQKNNLLSRYSIIASTRTENVCQRVKDVTPETCQELVKFHRGVASNLTYAAGEQIWFTPTPSGTIEACSWLGIQCGPKNSTGYRDVTAIQLPNRNLVGNLSGLIGLNALVILDLSHNPKITGTIPATYALPKLEELRLNDTNVNGALPSELGMASALEVLDVSKTRLDNILPTSLGNLSHLTEFRFNNTFITGKIPASFSKLTQLKVMDGSHTAIDGKLPELAALTALQELCFDDTALLGDVPASIVTLKLTKLCLSYARLEASGITLSFIQGFDPDFATTQTVPPTNVVASPQPGGTVTFNFTPILFTADSTPNDAYQLVCYNQSGQYLILAETADKTVSSLTVTNLEAGWEYQCALRTVTHRGSLVMNDLQSREGTFITVISPPLASASTVYPMKDTYFAPNASYANGWRRFVLAGTYTDYQAPGTPTTVNGRGYMWFDVEPYRGKNIDSVTLVLYMYGRSYPSMEFYIARGTGYWDDGIGYRDIGGYVSHAGDYGRYTFPNPTGGKSRVEINLDKQLIADLLAYGNNGIVLISTNEGVNSGVVFCSMNTDGYCTGDTVEQLIVATSNPVKPIPSPANQELFKEVVNASTFVNWDVDNGEVSEDALNQSVSILTKPDTVLTRSTPFSVQATSVEILVSMGNTSLNTRFITLTLSDEDEEITPVQWTCQLLENAPLRLYRFVAPASTWKKPVVSIESTSINNTGALLLSGLTINGLAANTSTSTSQCVPPATLVNGIRVTEEATDSIVYINENITLKPTLNGMPVSNKTVHWNIEGKTFDTLTASISFPTAGNHEVLVTVSDGKDTQSFKQTIVVQAAPKPVADFSFSYPLAQYTSTNSQEQPVPSPFAVTFLNTSQHLYGTGWTSTWTFGDGTTTTGYEVVHTYPGIGMYTVTLTVSRLGVSSTKTQTVEVVAEKPSGDFIFYQDGLLNVRYQSRMNNATKYLWTFRHGTTILTSTEANPTMHFPTNENWETTLVASNPIGSVTFFRSVLTYLRQDNPHSGSCSNCQILEVDMPGEGSSMSVNTRFNVKARTPDTTLRFEIWGQPWSENASVGNWAGDAMNANELGPGDYRICAVGRGRDGGWESASSYCRNFTIRDWNN